MLTPPLLMKRLPAKDAWQLRDLYRATPSVTRNHFPRQIPSPHLLFLGQSRGIEDLIFTMILTIKNQHQ